MPKDIVSSENKPAPKPWANQNFAERMATRAKNVINFIRGPATNQAVKMANNATFEMKSGQNVTPPPIGDTYTPGVVGPAGKNAAQLQTTTYNFNPTVGTAQTIEGFHLQAKPGKPTVVFFGGSEFNRSSPHYQQTISNMAYAAKQKGMGFVVFDYPDPTSEQAIKEHVAQMQNHMETNMGIPKNMQAYSGYSLGSFPAAHAANINQDSAGLQIVSGFSSARMAQKEGMGALGGLVDKSKLNTIMDTAKEVRDITTRNNGLPNGTPPMPMAAVYSKHEDFGKNNNRHMAPIIHEMGGGGNVDVQIADRMGPQNKKVDHFSILSSSKLTTSFDNFLNNVEARSNTIQQAQQQALGPQVQQNNAPQQVQVQVQNNAPTIVPQTTPQVQQSGTQLNTSTGVSDTQQVGRGRSQSVRDSLGDNGGPSKKGLDVDDSNSQSVGKHVKRSQSTGDLSRSTGYKH